MLSASNWFPGCGVTSSPRALRARRAKSAGGATNSRDSENAYCTQHLPSPLPLKMSGMLCRICCCSIEACVARLWVSRRNRDFNSPTIRLSLPKAVNGRPSFDEAILRHQYSTHFNTRIPHFLNSLIATSTLDSVIAKSTLVESAVRRNQRQKRPCRNRQCSG